MKFSKKILMSVGVLATPLLLAGFPRTVLGEVNISGHVESTYMYDFNEPSNRTTALRSYDSIHDSFYLNAAHIAITGELDEGSGFVVEVDHGNDAKVQTNDSAADDTDIQEAYLYFPIGPVTLTAGKFVTYEGIEVIEGPSNPTISRGYLYGLAEAFTHVGAKASLPLGEVFDISAGIVNGRDQDRDVNTGKTAIWRLGVTLGEMLSFGFSGSHGPQIADNAATTTHDESEDTTSSYDLTGTLSVIPILPINFQVLYAEQDNLKSNGTSGSWSGFGIQPVLELTEAFSIGMRAEYFDNHDSGNYNATNYTITPTYMVNEAVKVRAELRRDIVNSTQNAGPFTDDKGMAKGTATTASLGFSYSF